MTTKYLPPPPSEGEGEGEGESGLVSPVGELVLRPAGVLGALGLERTQIGAKEMSKFKIY